MRNYFGLTAIRLSATTVPSDFLNGEATWRTSVLVFKSIRSMVFVPATETHTLFPSRSRLPASGSVAPAGKVIVAGIGVVLRASATRTLLVPAGSTTAREPLDVTNSRRAVNAPMPKFTGTLLWLALGGQNCVPGGSATVTVSTSKPVEFTA